LTFGLGGWLGFSQISVDVDEARSFGLSLSLIFREFVSDLMDDVFDLSKTSALANSRFMMFISLS